MYHRAFDPADPNNGHRGSYWGPGMGCGEDWVDFNYMKKDRLLDDINAVFSGEGYRIIKSHFFARRFNLDFLWNNFKGDKIVLIYREPQKSFAWWSEVMNFAPDHYPDYRPGYTDFNTMHKLLWEESVKITDFAMRKNMKFEQYSVELFKNWDGYDMDAAAPFIEVNKTKHTDVYMATATI